MPGGGNVGLCAAAGMSACMRKPLGVIRTSHERRRSYDHSNSQRLGRGRCERPLAWILEKHPEIVDPETKEILLRAAEHVATDESFYEANVSIYGRFDERFNRIKRLSRRPPRH
jgi:hypothetical protein